jgi:hypothetical protein
MFHITTRRKQKRIGFDYLRKGGLVRRDDISNMRMQYAAT